MQINQLKIENLRNINFAQLHPGENINFIVGGNGAGKSTILESIYLLGRARSFRQNTRRGLVNEKEEVLNLFARIETSANTRHQLGLQKTKSRTIIRRDGKNIEKLSLLARSLPLTFISPNIQRLIEEEPKNRRRLLNWGMFHVEHEYSDLLNRYKRTLTQRNNALKYSLAQLRVWDKELTKLGMDIHTRMVEYTTYWNETFNKMLDELEIIKPINIELKTGWREEMTLEEAMDSNLKIDKERGFTSSGPHRADIRITQDGCEVKTQFSRGEMKVTALVMLISQTAMIKKVTGECPIMLIDDLHSELDERRYRSLLSLISAQKLQSFVTTLKIDKKDIANDIEGFRVFHVEHGQVSDS